MSSIWTPEFTERIRQRDLLESHRQNSFVYSEFQAGRRVVLVRDVSELGRFSRQVLSAIDSLEEWLALRDPERPIISVITEDSARREYGWNSASHVRAAPVTHEARVRALTDDLRAQTEAKRIVQAERNPVEPLELQSVADLLEAPDPEWWVDNILPKNAVVIVGGDGGVGKSALLVEMVARLSTGTPFLSDYPTKRAKILYAVGEGVSGYGVRFRAVGLAHGLDPEQVRTISKGVSLTSEKSMEQVRNLVAESEVDVVIFDTLSSLSTLESENDAAEVARVLNAAKYVRESNPGCTVVIVHHTTKATGGLRGSSVIRDNADVVWMLRGDPDAFFMSTKSKHGGKVKDGEPLEIHGLSLVGAHGSVIVESASMPRDGVGADDKRAGLVADLLISGDEYTTGQLRELIRRSDTHASDATAKRTISTLLAAGKITSISKGRYRA